MEESDETSIIPSSNSLDVVIDTTRSLTLMDACNSLPPRAMVDKLLSGYFNARHMSLRKYAAFIIQSSVDIRSHHSQWEVSTRGKFSEHRDQVEVLIITSTNLSGLIRLPPLFCGSQSFFRLCTLALRLIKTATK